MCGLSRWGGGVPWSTSMMTTSGGGGVPWSTSMMTTSGGVPWSTSMMTTSMMTTSGGGTLVHFHDDHLWGGGGGYPGPLPWWPLLWWPLPWWPLLGGSHVTYPTIQFMLSLLSRHQNDWSGLVHMLIKCCPKGLWEGHMGPPRQTNMSENITFRHTTYAVGNKVPKP